MLHAPNLVVKPIGKRFVIEDWKKGRG